MRIKVIFKYLLVLNFPGKEKRLYLPVSVLIFGSAQIYTYLLQQKENSYLGQIHVFNYAYRNITLSGKSSQPSMLKGRASQHCDDRK